MAVPVTLPKMGESVVEGTIIRWLKAEGEWVEEDEPIVEISTDKIDAEMPSPAAGVLQKIIAQPDQTVDVGAEIAIIDETASKDGGTGAPAAAPEQPATEAPEPPRQEAPPAEAPPPPPKAEKPAPAPPPAHPQQPARGGNGQAVVTSPLVRKLAREQGVDLSTVSGSGVGGRVTKEDVLAAASERPAAEPQKRSERAPAPAATSTFKVPRGEFEDVPFSRIRKAIADHMTRSLQTAAQLTNVIEVDLTDVARLRSKAKADFEDAEGVKLTFMPFIASAVVQAMRAFPEFNAHILDDGSTARLYRQVNLGIAVGRDEGLIVPVVHGADGMNIVGLARAIADIAERARTKGGLKPDDVTGGTFTITNYGSAGAVLDTPIISQPQVAILGTGALVKRPAVITVDGADAIAVRQMMYMSLTYDHRWIDGHRAAQFVSRIRHILETEDFVHELGL